MQYLNRKRIRLPDYSYSSSGSYFITICSANQQSVFGTVYPGDVTTESKVHLSKIGTVVLENIKFISVAYPKITVDKYVIMPNHIHLILSVCDDGSGIEQRRDKMLISKCIQSFKSSVSRQTTDILSPVWQARFFDRVIRDKDEYRRIWKYIDENPAKWALDRYYSE